MVDMNVEGHLLVTIENSFYNLSFLFLAILVTVE